MQQLTLDKTDPDVAALIGSWQNGQSYRVTLDITQQSSDASKAVFDVEQIETADEPELDEPESPMMERPKPASYSVAPESY